MNVLTLEVTFAPPFMIYKDGGFVNPLELVFPILILI
jgi:hypothetical protein